MARRREERICVELPVRVWGLDSLGKPFSGSASTMDITRTGARLRGITVPLRPGEVIGIQHANEKARFRVAWAGRVGMNPGQIGVCCVEPGKYIWGRPLAELQRLAQAQAAANPPAPHSTTPPPRTQAPGVGTAGVAARVAPEPASIVKKIDDGRRIAARFACRGGAEVRDQSGNRLWATVADLSMTGCYVETFAPLAAGARVSLAITVENTQIHATAEVKTSHPTVGMGLSFIDMSAEDRERVDRLMRQFAGPSATPAISKHAVPAAVPAVTAGGGEDKLESLIHMLTLEIQQLEGMVSSGAIKLEPALLAEVRNSADALQKAAALVQKWLGLQRENQNGFEVLEELAAYRLQATARMVQTIALDVDSSAVHLSTPGLAELRTAVGHLEHRLDKLTQPERGLSNLPGLPGKG